MRKDSSIRRASNHGASRKAVAGFVLLLLLGSAPAQAYLDPSTGSMVISAIVGIVASVVLAVKTYWYRLKSLFRRKSENSSRPRD